MNTLKDKTILITGGTGSFGKNFIRFLLDQSEVKKIIVFSRDELKQSEMQREIQDVRLRFFLGDVRDLERLRRAFFEVDVVVHAAALKQVPTLEYNPFEAVKTNIMGTQNVIDAAIDLGVEKVVLISTDKAAQPINLYGSTKQCAEKLFVAGNSYAAGRTRFSCVRYGNVIGSRGSIIEMLLREKDAREVTVTDEGMTRFWLSLDESFKLVCFALEHMVGGEIFIPKDIPSMRMGDVFAALAPNAKKKIIGIRPGEKMHEVLLTEEEARRAVVLGKYFVVLPEYHHAVSMEKFEPYRAQGETLPDGFSFRSDTNTLQMSKEDLCAVAQK
ncbi:UDP-N-acetylglucosamine 4,6-dehydratase (inverting) [bacterium CG10_46_32]|nr:MAG: UDP-N-acetylglucosamine 4,6-dehydratase (inverting) [bacterium CG10_46_32]PIR56375.1 MAG: UDP-N-acetylglucosamine 4,6-dehydratase (inverting) [Parcubacteria group bacterium CG10_big_fil_rev_8_21_14_0_10_46_32]